MADKRVVISCKRADYPASLVQAVELELIPGVLHVPRLRDACWLWLGGVNNMGYGQTEFRVGGRKNMRCNMGTHVLMFRHYHRNDQPLHAYLQTNHRCEVRSCANPRHLYAGTQSQNMYDLWARGAARDQGILRMEVEAQVVLRGAMCRPVPAYFRRAAVSLGLGRILEGYNTGE